MIFILFEQRRELTAPRFIYKFFRNVYFFFRGSDPKILAYSKCFNYLLFITFFLFLYLPFTFFIGFFACLSPMSVVCPRSFPDVKVGDGYPHQIRLERCCLGVHRLPRLIKHRILRILIRTFLCVLQHFKRPFLRGCVCPSFPDAIPDFRFCRRGGKFPSRRAKDTFQDCEDFLPVASACRPSLSGRVFFLPISRACHQCLEPLGCGIDVHTPI